MPSIQSITLSGDKYELTLTGGKRVKVGVLRSEGKPRKDDAHFDHVFQYSDGVSKKAVLSSKVAVVPDYSALD